MSKIKIDAVRDWLSANFAVKGATLEWIRLLVLLIILVAVWIAMVYVAKRIIINLATRISKRTTTVWDDAMLKEGVFQRLAHLLPAVLIDASHKYILEDFPKFQPRIDSFLNAYVIVVFVGLVNAALNAVNEMLLRKESLRDKPIKSYIQLSKILIYFIAGILIISGLLNKSPLIFLTTLGAASAVLLLIFKDTILGLVASIQLSANDMVRIGDWVTMDKYGADGDVVEINLSTIKVKNFDMTISTVPTYAFISDSFKNWRGMTESDGRRIKRAVKINKNSVKFCTQAMLDKYSQIDLVKPYILKKQIELSAHNVQFKINKDLAINGLNLTNIGIFRKYIDLYLEQNQNINQNMMHFTRHLPPSETGLPIEIYAFSKEKDFIEFEEVVADIFDHILAAVPYFDLTVFQNPSGADFSNAMSQK